MKLIIFGASGQTGRELVRQAVAHDHLVTAFVRNPAEFEIRHHNLEVVEGDIRAFDQVERAIKGKDAVVSTLGPHTLMNRVPELVTGISNIVQAMENVAVRRLVYTSALGVGDSAADQNAVFRYVILPVLLGRDYADHEANEKTIRESNLEWIIVRPARLVNSERTGRYQVDLRLSATFPFGRIGRADVADFILNQLEDPSFLRKTPGLLAYRSFWESE